MSLVDEGQPFSLTAAQNSAAISITDSGFSPDTVTIPVDTAVIWTNNTTRSHILVSGNVQYRAYLPVILAANSNGNSHSQPTAVTADSFRVTIAPGDTFSYTYATIGAHPFYLETAPGTTGQVTVQDSSTSLTLDPIGNQTVTISNTLQLQLTAVYTGGGQLTYFANPLPANAALQPTSGAFQFTPDSSQIGSVSITFGVSDGVLTDTETIQMTVAPVSLSLNVVGPQTAVLGQTLSFTLTAAYEGQNSLTYGATTLPLPAQASLDAATGQFAFTPDENQIGDIGLNFYVTDGVLQASEWVTITVPPPNPSDDTALHGRILDANDAAVGVTTPLVGATVTNIETGINTTTNASGYFTLTGLISGTNHFDFQGSTAVPAGTYGAYRADKYLIGHVTTIVDRPIYIMALDTAGQVPVDPNNTTVVDNPNISTTVTIPPHTVMDENGNEYNGLISISPVPVGFTPGSLPDTLNPDQVITVQPMGLTFATPAPVTFPNSSGLSSGSKVDIWSMDHDLGIFFIAGTGQVSADGQWINTISGGIREASWHFPMSPAGDGNGGGDGPGDNDGNGPPCNGGSTVTLENGCLGTRISLPPYVSLGESRALELVYKSNRAYPQPVLPFEATILQRSAVPDLISYDLTVGGVNMGNPVYVDTSGLDENQDETIRGAVSFDGSVLATGAYPYAIELTNYFGNSSVSSSIFGQTMVVNDQGDPLGAGWEVANLQRLYIDEQNVLLANGDGKTTNFISVSSFEFLDFSDLSGFLLNGDANTLNSDPVIFGGQAVLRLTDDVWQRSSTFLTRPIPLMVGGNAVSWDTAFQFQITDSGGLGGGADGLTFAVVTDPSSLGAIGDGLGYQGITPSIAIEIDTYSGNHVGIDVNGSLNSVVEQNIVPDLNNDAVWSVWADYDGVTDLLEMRLSETSIRPVTPTLTYTIDLATNMGQSEIFMGFTAATGNGYGDHDIRAWEVNLSNSLGEVGWYLSPEGDYSTLAKNLDDTFTRRMKDGTEYHFDANGRQTTMVDRNGNTTVYAYDANGRLTTITDPAGLVTAFTYSNSLLSSISNPGGTTTFQHDAQGNLTGVTYPDGSGQTFGYDGRHLMSSETDPNGELTVRQYDSLGRWVSSTLPDGTVRQATTSQVVGWVDPASGLGTQSNPAPVVRPADAVGTLTDGEGHTTVYGIGPVQQFSSIIDPANFTTTITLNEDGAPLQTIMPSGAVFDRTFDGRGNLLTFTDQTLGGTTISTYDTVYNQIASLTNPFSQTTTFDYDGSGNLIGITSPLNRAVGFGYNSLGLVTTMTDTLGTVTQYGYNANGNLAGLTQNPGPNQRSASMSYTPAGYLETLTDPLGRIFDFSYDSLGRLITETLPANRTISYGYDAAGNMSTITPPGRPAHTFTYTELDLMAAYTAPAVTGGGTNQTIYAYNFAQQLELVTRPDNLTLDYQYDSAGRLDSLVIPRGTYDYSYSAVTGQLNQISAPGGINLAYSYNNDILTDVAWSGPVTGTVSYDYDAAARLTDLTVSGASGSPTPFSFSYDADDMLTQAGDLTLNYDAQTGLINDTTLDNTTDSWSFNPFTELNSYSAAYNSADVFAVQYGRDDLGRITQKVETVSGQTVTTTYSYDAAGRLETETVNGNNIATYTYDSNGNRLSDGTNNAAYDDQDRLLQYGSASYSYTANGELLTKTVGGQTTAYTYDVLGNLVGVTLPNSDQITYLIDGDNRRIGKLVNGTLVQGFLYQDGLNPVAELDGNGDIVSLFIYASQSNVPDYMIKNGIKYRIISDHLGSPRLIINSQTGVVAQEMHYTGFGQVTQNTTPNFQPFGFAGGLYDTDTSLVRFGARDYDAENGRWTTKDPIKFASYSTNHYTYLGSEPINHTDLSGLICGTGACVAVGIGAVRATQIGWRIYNAYKAGQAAASIANSLPNISPSDDASSGTQGSEEPGSCSADNTEDSESGDEGGTRGGSQPNIGAGRPKWEDILRNGPKKIGPSTPGKGGSRGR